MLHYTTLIHYTTLHPLHLITLHYTNYTALQQQQLLPQLQLQLQLHHITLHCTGYTAAHYNCKYQSGCNYITLHNATLMTWHYTTTTTANAIATTTKLRYATLH